MKERIFGMEKELAFVARDHNGSVADRDEALTRIQRLAELRLPNLPGCQGGDIFIQNSSRLYRDAGGGYCHLEFAGPECANPWDVVRYDKANNLILNRLAGEAVSLSQGALTDAVFNQTGVDYSGRKTAWGCHENYLTTVCEVLEAGDEMLPHLVSRVVFTGAGGFDNLCSGVRFTLSPRVCHVTQVSGYATEHDRPLLHSKDESLADPERFRRLHIICGEATQSELATWLKFATTSLVLAMIEAGLAPCHSLQISAPVRAVQRFASDPSCRTRVRVKDGRRLSAVQIQRELLHLAETHRTADFMPPWAEEACRKWRGILDALASQGERGGHGRLDWATKLPLFRARAARHGFSWEELPQWNRAMRCLTTALTRLSANDPDVLLTGTGSLRDHYLEQAAAVASGIKVSGVDWKRLPGFLKLRDELFEIDWRWGELGEKSLFTTLDRAGLLSHHVDGVDNFEHAVANPPNFGRALVRGRHIRALAGEKRGRYYCDWNRIVDAGERRVLDLSDPFDTREHWQAPQPDARGCCSRGAG
jgi:proteasome accessory factor A